MAEKKVLVLNPLTGELQQHQAGDTVFGLTPNQTAATAAALATETTARIAGDNAQASALAAEATARAAADATLAADLQTEITARQNAVISAGGSVAAETTARIAADATLQAAIDTEVAARVSAVSAEALLRANADTTLQANINTEITARIAGDDAAAAALLVEVTARTAADTAAASALAVEVTARTAADTTLTNNLAAEVARATAAETTLAAAIATEVTARESAITAVNARVDALGSAFNYVNTIAGGADSGTAYDLTGLAAEGKNTGDYYKVSTSGFFRVGAGTPFFANIGDGLVWNTGGSVDLIDNTNSTVAAGANITVTGSTDTGYTVAVATVFSDRVTALESANTSGGTALLAEITARTNADLAEASARIAGDAAEAAALLVEVTARVAGDAAQASALATEVTARAAADTTLQANIAAEAAARAAAEATAAAALATEVTARTAADTTLTNNLAAEVARATAAEVTLQANINAEATARANADTTLTNAIATETSNRIAVEGLLADLDGGITVVDNLVGAINFVYNAATTGAQSDLSAAILLEQIARADGDASLQDNIDAEALARGNADIAAASALATEVSARIAADATLTTNLSNEVTRATNAEAALTSALNTEITARTNAVSTLTSDLATEASARAAADATLTTNLAAELVARAAADATLQTAVDTKVSKAGDSMSGQLSMGDNKIVALATPTAGTDAANKAYVDARVAGLTWKNSVVVASGTNITLSGEQTVDGVAVVAGQRVLVMGQTAASANGIYVVAAGAWARAEDFDSLTPLDEVNGAAVYVQTGSTYGDAGYTVTSQVATLNTDSIVFTQFNGASSIDAGIGLAKVGNTLSVNLGAGIAQLPSDEVGIELYSAGTGALVLTTDGSTYSTDTAAKLHLLLNSTGGLEQASTGLAINLDEAGAGESGLVLSASGLKIGAGKVTNAMLAHSSITMNGATGTKVVDLGASFAILGDNASGVVTSISGSDLTISLAAASSTQKGAASFGSDFTVTAGDVALAVTGVTAGSYGSATAIPTFTVDSKGRLSAAGTVAIDTTSSASTVTTTGAAAGDAVYVSGAGATTKAQADAAGTTKVVGIVSATGKVVTSGVVTVAGWSLTPGARYFLSESTAGLITATVPTTGYVAPVGIAVSATSLAIQIGMPIQL